MRKRWHKLLCWMSDCVFTFFHETEDVETYDPFTRKLRCVHCGKYFAMSDRHQAVLPWDEEMEAITCLLYGLPRTKR